MAYFAFMMLMVHVVAFALFIVFPGVSIHDRIQTCFLIAIFATMCMHAEDLERWRKESRKNPP